MRPGSGAGPRAGPTCDVSLGRLDGLPRLRQNAHCGGPEAQPNEQDEDDEHAAAGRAQASRAERRGQVVGPVVAVAVRKRVSVKTNSQWFVVQSGFAAKMPDSVMKLPTTRMMAGTMVMNARRTMSPVTTGTFHGPRSINPGRKLPTTVV